MKKLYIITGASGFLGNNIVSKLVQAGEGENEIRALVLPGDEAKSLDGLDCRIFYGDVTKKETLAEIFDFVTLPRHLDKVMNDGIASEAEIFLILKEYKRIKEFSRLAINSSDGMNLATELYNVYDLSEYVLQDV